MDRHAVVSLKKCHKQLCLQGACQAVLLAAALMLALSGCSKRYSDLPAYSPIDFADYENHSVGRFKTSFLAEQIDEYYRGTNPGPLGVTTFVNLDDLYTTSSFGRMVSEQLLSELAMRGFDVIELRHSDALHFLNPSGEFGLSRDIAVVRRNRDLGGIVVGTYVVSPERVYLNARLVEPSTSMVLSAGSVEMPKTKEIARLARAGGLPGTLERIPVRHLGLTSYPLNPFPSYVSRPFDSEEGSWNEQPLIEPRFSEPPAKPRKK